MARLWALDERNWYADGSPCWVKYERAVLPLQYERYEGLARPLYPTTMRSLARSVVRDVQTHHGRIVIIAVQIANR